MLDPRSLERIQRKKAKLDALRPLAASVLSRLREQIVVEWIYNSNAIEGSTITLQETRLILETGMTVGGKSLREHFEVINHHEAIAYVESLVLHAEPISAFHVRQIHHLVLSRIDDSQAGNYRTTQVRIAGAGFAPPESWQVASMMNEWEQWLAAEESATHPVTVAALAHHRLVAIHPFVDGNGRTARLIMNLILMRAGYPPTIIQRINRKQYYRVLEQADRGRTEPLVNFVGRAVERSLNLYLEAAEPVIARPAAEDEWIPLRAAAEGTPYSQEYLSLLARTGRLEAVKRGRNWFTTRRALEHYRRSVS